MAYANDIRTSREVFGRIDVFGAVRSAIQNGVDTWGRYRLYRTTLNELTVLADRELADIGLTRSSLRAVALETAYGK